MVSEKRVDFFTTSLTLEDLMLSEFQDTIFEEQYDKVYEDDTAIFSFRGLSLFHVYLFLEKLEL